MCNNTTMENGVGMERPVYAAVFGTVLVLGLPLNAIALGILLRCHSLKTTSAVFMVNLAISDLVLVISLPMRVYFYATGIWPLGHMACIWITMLFRNNIRSSSIFITFICVDRLLAVVYPLRSRHLRTPSNAWKAAGLVWILIVVVNIPESVHFSQFLQQCKITSCFEFEDPPESPLVHIQSVLTLAMLAVNVVCTFMVSWTLHRKLSDSARVSNKVNVLLIFVMNLIMFAVFFLPFSLYTLFDSEAHHFTPLVCLASVNCCLDPLLYYFSFDGFWKRKEEVDMSAERE
ncbi:uncharacterized protein V6R79_021766 [Siganus canaliculatus]